MPLINGKNWEKNWWQRYSFEQYFTVVKQFSNNLSVLHIRMPLDLCLCDNYRDKDTSFTFSSTAFLEVTVGLNCYFLNHPLKKGRSSRVYAKMSVCVWRRQERPEDWNPWRQKTLFNSLKGESCSNVLNLRAEWSGTLNCFWCACHWLTIFNTLM